MDKALEIFKVNTPEGVATIVLDEKNELYVRAYEIAGLFGFKDEKDCIRNYGRDAKMIIIPTQGGNQPVKCIPIDVVNEIANHSRLKTASQIVDKLEIMALRLHAKDLSVTNIILSDDLDYAICSLKDLRKQLDEILFDLE